MTKRLIDLDIHKIGDTIQMIGAVYAGEGEALLCLFPGETVDPATTSALTMDHEDWKAFLKQADTVEVEVLMKDKSTGELVKAYTRKCQRQIDAAVMWKVFRRDSFACRYCGADDVPMTVDHLICWEVGGPSIEANLVTSCKKCNGIRGKTVFAAWLEHPYYEKVSRNVPPQARAALRQLCLDIARIPVRPMQRSR